MDERRKKALWELALAEDIYFDAEKDPDYIFSIRTSDDYEMLKRNEELFGGYVNSNRRDYRSIRNASRGQFQWTTEDKICYNFCLEIEPILYITKSIKHKPCRQCIDRWERENH